MPKLRVSPEWVTRPEQGKSGERTATISLWTSMSGIAFLPPLTKKLHRCDSVVIDSCGNKVHHKKVSCWVREVTVLRNTTTFTNTEIAEELHINQVLDKTQDYIKKLDTTCIQNTSLQINEDNKKIHTKRQKEPERPSKGHLNV